MERILAKTRFNNTEYTILQRNQNIEFTSNRNNVENKNLNKNEIAILSYIYNYICINPKTLQFMGDIRFSGNVYSIFIDKRTEIYTLLLKKDGKYYEPSIDVTKQFNTYFNNQSDIVFNDDEDYDNCYDAYDEKIESDIKFDININEPYYDSGMDQNFDEIDLNKDLIINIRNKRNIKKFFKRVVKIGSASLMVFVISGVCLASLPRNTQFSIKNTVDYIISKDFKKTNKDFEYSDIVEAIYSNPNITEDDKKFIKEILYKEFEENKEYINIPVLIDRLKTVQVEYKKRKIWNEEKQEYESTEKEYEPTSSAYYTSYHNKIVCFDYVNVADLKNNDELYNNRIYSFDNARLTDYFHELNHLQTVNSIEADLSVVSRDLGIDYNSYLSENYDTEGINEFDEKENFVGRYYRYKIKEKDLKKLKNIQNIKNNSTIYYNVLYYETINELFAREYYEEYGDKHPKRSNNSTGYADEIPYMYLLAELLPTDVLREYKYNNNISILINGLKEIDGKSDKAYELILNINCINFYERKKEIILYGIKPGITEKGEECSLGLSEQEKQQLDELDKEIEDNYKKIHDSFAYFYNKKYNRNMSNDMIMISYLLMTPCATLEEKINYLNFLNVDKASIENFCPKGYFSEYYKEKHPSVTFKIKDGVGIKDVEIGEHNRYQTTKEEKVEER